MISTALKARADPIGPGLAAGRIFWQARREVQDRCGKPEPPTCSTSRASREAEALARREARTGKIKRREREENTEKPSPHMLLGHAGRSISFLDATLAGRGIRGRG